MSHYHPDRHKVAFPTNEAAQILRLLLTLLFWQSLARVLFVVLNHGYIDSSVGALVHALLNGLRFDLAVIALIQLPLLFALALGAGLSDRKWLKRLLVWFAFIPNSLALLLNFSDIIYYRNAFRRQTDELIRMPDEVFTAAFSELVSYWWLALLLIAALMGLYISICKALRRGPRLLSSGSLVWLGRSTLAGIVLALSVISARGGLQDRPLRPAMAFVSENIPLAHVSLHSCYTCLWSLAHPTADRISFVDERAAIETARSMVRASGERFLDTEYPFWRVREESADAEKRYNVVVLIFESWNGRQTASIVGGKSITPNFDSLARGGLLFTNFYASGHRSIHAFPAVFASLPNLVGSRLMHSNTEMDRIRGLGAFFKKRGYRTIFGMGAKPTAMGFDSFARLCGLDEYYHLQSYPDHNPETVDPTWGVFDERFLQFLEEQISQSERPFLLGFFSLTGHGPHHVPPSFAEKYPIAGEAGYDESSDALGLNMQTRSLFYADYALGEFMRAASSRSYFENTLFVITADHVGFARDGATYTALDKFHIPLLLYAPALIKTGRDTRPASQVDILPTILSALNLEDDFSALGGSLIDSARVRFATFSGGGVYGFVTDSLFLQTSLDSALGFYNYKKDPELENNLLRIGIHRAELDSTQRLFRGYLQTTVNAIIDDKIYPPQQ
ncbi:MAG: LTA synthase family protein, partial [Candidatus Zixiibacteriota bacterium]